MYKNPEGYSGFGVEPRNLQLELYDKPSGWRGRSPGELGIQVLLWPIWSNPKDVPTLKDILCVIHARYDEVTPGKRM